MRLECHERHSVLPSSEAVSVQIRRTRLWRKSGGDNVDSVACFSPFRCTISTLQ